MLAPREGVQITGDLPHVQQQKLNQLDNIFPRKWPGSVAELLEVCDDLKGAVVTGQEVLKVAVLHLEGAPPGLADLKLFVPAEHVEELAHFQSFLCNDFSDIQRG